MQNFIITITAVEWGLLGIALVALLIAWMAWRRAGRALQFINKVPVTEIHYEEPVQQQEEEQEQRPAVSLEITVNKNEHDQVTLELYNDGLLAARQVNITISKPNHVFDAGGLSDGIELTSSITASPVILPRLTVLDTDNKLPIKEIPSGNRIELSAALTMSRGKVCEFPVSLEWKDENGVSQQKQLTLTI